MFQSACPASLYPAGKLGDFIPGRKWMNSIPFRNCKPSHIWLSGWSESGETHDPRPLQLKGGKEGVWLGILAVAARVLSWCVSCFCVSFRLYVVNCVSPNCVPALPDITVRLTLIPLLPHGWSGLKGVFTSRLKSRNCCTIWLLSEAHRCKYGMYLKFHFSYHAGTPFEQWLVW